jgi:S1-C subfamily serine protease
MANPERLRVGHVVLALGRPGRSVQATVGIVSALSEDAWRTPRGGKIHRYLQTDVVMYPGFSGGPLLDTDGEVVGLNSSRLIRGLSLAVPAQTLGDVALVLSEHGRIRHGYIGVSAQSVKLPAELADTADQETGLLLVAIESDGPAAKAGLLMGDTLLSLAQNSVGDIEELLSQLSGDRIGEDVQLQVVRGGELMEFKLTIGERG